MNRDSERRIAYLQVPDFGMTVARAVEPQLDAGGRAVVLLDGAGIVLAANAAAEARGIGAGQTERQAVARWPQADCRPAARYPIFETQAALLDRIAGYADRRQPAGLGAVYLDATALGGDTLGWCQELAQGVRTLALAPAIGVAGSKFAANAAGLAAAPYEALVLDQAAQVTFLARQTAGLLPLGAAALLELRHLGIRTLGQYARLPVAGVLTRWGQAGRTAQLWAQGQDLRPVTRPEDAPELSGRIEFDGAVADRAILLAAVMRRIERLLQPLRDGLRAVGWLSLAVTRGDGRSLPPVKHAFVMPTTASNPIYLAVEAGLGRVAWDNNSGAADVTVTLGGITDAPAPQLTLFDTPTPREALAATLADLTERFGADAFCAASLTAPDHPLPERRASWSRFP